MQVDSTKYNSQYYEKAYGKSELIPDKGYFANTHVTKYQEIGSLVELLPTDTVVDYGCGIGDLTIYLAATYKCNVIAMDYSKEAIDICKNKLDKLPELKTKVQFLQSNSNSLPKLQDIKAVYFCDVVEHIADDELRMVLDQMKKWNTQNPINIIVNTDNNNYLKYIRPVFNSLLTISKGKEWTRMSNEMYERDKILHINLTTPNRLQNNMENWGFNEIIRKYPDPDLRRIKMQLANIMPLPYLYELCAYILKNAPFLSPSFYAVYKDIIGVLRQVLHK